MLNFINAENHLLAFDLVGKLNEEDMKMLQQALLSKIESNETVNILCDISALEDLSPQAFIAGSKTDLTFLEHLNQFDRMALISDKTWPQALLSIASSLLPNVELRLFKSSEKNLAKDWCEKEPETNNIITQDSEKSVIKIIPTNKENALGIEINGTITQVGLPEALQEMQSKLDQHDSLNLLTHIKSFGGFTPSIFMQHGLFSMKMAAAHKVKRYAIVGAPSWMAAAVKAMNPLFSEVEMKLFNEEALDEAWQWINAHPINQ